MADAPKPVSSYRSRPPDASGRVAYSRAEDAVWALLHERQQAAVARHACEEFRAGLRLLDLSPDRVPQLPEVSARLRRASGWEVVAVPALIPFSEFFALLSERRFPAATFIRRREHLDYLQEPDIFHELFGHAPLLTQPDFAAFTQRYGEIGLAATREERTFLARLYWFTVEFGLIGGPDARNGKAAADACPVTEGGAQAGDVRIYGGGILSSPAETAHALGPLAQHRPFQLLEVLRMPYRIDQLQPLYYRLAAFAELQALTRLDLLAAVAEARRLGLQAPLFPARPLAA